MAEQKFPDCLFVAGHRACAGCGPTIVARQILNATGPNTIVCTSTGCLEVTSSPYPESAWRVPWIHSLFENPASVAAGIETARRVMGKPKANVICICGDGSTADISIGPISGMMERGHDVTYICYDNEAYMNTGIQRSGSTPYDASTTTTPAGKKSFGNRRQKKNLPAIAVAHGAPYVATSSVAYPADLRKKVQKAISVDGPKYLQIHAPCPTGWYFDPAKTIAIGKLAIETALFPIFEMENGELTSVRKIKDRKKVEEYLKLQGRFRHLFKTQDGTAEIKKIQKIADNNAKWFKLDA